MEAKALAAVGAERDTMRAERDTMRDERDALRQEKVDQRNHKNRKQREYRAFIKAVKEDPDAEEGEVRTNPHTGKDYVIVFYDNGKKKACHHHAKEGARDVIRPLLHRANNNHEASGSNDPLPAEPQP